MESKIVIRGAREHNLKNISLEIPRNRLVVITGLSGSGKSSLAFDTLYAEGQRRYLESLSSYARQFLERLKKPDVDYISGLSPSIAIEQKSIPHNPRSTVATVTEIYDYLRLLYAKVGEIFCPHCGRRTGKQSLSEIVSQVKQIAPGTQIGIFAPLVRGRKGEYRKLFQETAKKGFSYVRIDRKLYDLSKPIKISKTKRHDIEVLVDTVELIPKNANRIERSLETALDLAEGACLVNAVTGDSRKSNQEYFFSKKMTCPKCGISFKDFAPNMFSFNSPYGACSRCRGIGKLSQVMASQVIRHPEKPLLKGAINEEIYFSFNQYVIEDLIYELSEHFKFNLSTPYRDLPQEAKDALFWGTEEITGLIEELEDLFYSTSSEEVKRKVRKFVREDICPECRGSRLKQESLGVKIGGENIVNVCRMSVDQAHPFFERLHFEGSAAKISTPILKEVRQRIQFLQNVGLGYLTLDRSVMTLAGGELQRIRLAAQIGVGLTGVLYVLDEPSIGLHPKDNEKLLNTLTQLRDLKNTVIVVEHDEETMRRADYVIDLGPGAGREGGEIVGLGEPAKFTNNGFEKSLTAKYLSGELSITLPHERQDYRKAEMLTVKGCREHNLKGINVQIPLGCFSCVTGVSGSGKSTLVHDILFKALHNHIWKTNYTVGKFKSIGNINRIDKVIEIDQTPIGRTPRSNPATYTDLFTFIRRLYAQTPEAKLRNFDPSRFSFNLKGGRCETCRGEGYQKLEMSFLPDVYVLCEVCRGLRYNEQTLVVQYRGRNIAEVLDLSIREALDFFSEIPQVRERLDILNEIGLGYVKLGQPSTTLSGGEAQRIKLASELGKKSTGHTLYILDEPTTGLHFADVANLLKALFRLRDEGNTVLVVEHNLELVKMADYIIDLGPEGGESGGYLVGAGFPEGIVKIRNSHTGSYLSKYLK
ncbi:MAG TPA: excinuclease ABC subunit UvrA [Candidatus Omnitrophota bacterium]|nr:excinuclease ABC subunit UvrA [Candidatus Omnitrophota bacterium]